MAPPLSRAPTGNWDRASKERFEFGATLGCEVATAETKKRQAFRAEFADLMGEDGILALPTMPGAAPLKSTSFDNIQAFRERALRLLCLSGLSGLPADQPAARLRGRRTLRDLADRPRRLGLDFDRFGTPDHGERQ